MSIVKVGPNKYRIFVSAGFKLDGTRKRYSKTITTDLKGRDLDRFLRQAELDFENEIFEKSITYNEMASQSFSNYANWWLNYVKLTDQTKESYRYNLKFIEKYIGHKRLSDITQSDMLPLIELN